MAEDDPQRELSRTQKYFICNQVCFWLVQLVVVVLGFVVMAKVVMGYQASRDVIASEQYQHSLETIRLWRQGYIIDIKVEKTNNCPEGYQPLLAYQWLGTIDGCSCSSTTNGYSFPFVLEGRCNSQLISLGCNTVNSITAQTLNMWKGSSLLCYKRANAMSFYQSVLTEAPLGGTSPNMTVCAANTVYEVNTLPGVPCPVTAFSNNTVGASQTTLSLDSSSSSVLNFIDQSGYPISDFKLTEYQFCSFFNQSNISPNKGGTYILENSNLNTPCAQTDPRMVEVDSMDELNLYQNNSRVYALIQTLPAYPMPSIDYNYKLGYIPYPTWAHSCRASANYDLYAATDKLEYNQPRQAMEITAGVVVACVLTIVILFRLFFIIRHIADLRSRSTYNALMLTDDEIAEQMPNLDITKSSKQECCLFVTELVLILGIAISVSYAIATMTTESVWIKNIIKQQCTDTYLENIFLFYQHKTDYTSEVLIEASFVWAVLIITHVIYYILRHQIGDLSTKTIEAESEKEASVNSAQFKVMDKENRIDGNIDSSEIILQKEDASELKVYDMEFLMGDNAGETKSNFFGGEKEGLAVSKKKKKKRKTVTKKKKEKEPDPLPDFEDDFNF